MPERGRIHELPDTAWMLDAACRGMPTDMFFAPRGSNINGNDHYEVAREVCDRCPVRDQCLDMALATPYNGDTGMWGGTTPRQRRRIRMLRRDVENARTDPFRRSIG